MDKKRQNKVVLFKDPSEASKTGTSNAELEQGFAQLRMLRNSTAREELPKKLEATVKKLRQRR